MPKRTLPPEQIEQFTNQFFDEVEKFLRSPRCFDVLMSMLTFSAEMINLRAQKLKKRRIFPDSVREQFAKSLKDLDRQNLKMTLEYMNAIGKGESRLEVVRPFLNVLEQLKMASETAARGRETLDELWEQAQELKQKGFTWGQVALKLTPEEFQRDRHLAVKRIQAGVRRWLLRNANSSWGTTMAAQKRQLLLTISSRK